MSIASPFARFSFLRPLATLLFMLVLATIFSPHDRDGHLIFWQGQNVSNVLRQISDIGILAMGMTLVIIGGGIDLGVGSLLALSCCIFARIFREWEDPRALCVAVLAAIGLTTALGLFNGAVIARLRMQPFIVTLATMIGARGLARHLTDNRTIAIGFDERTRPWVEFISQQGFVVSAFLLVTLLSAVLLNLTRFGRYLMALGGSESAARLSGINVTQVKLRVYAYSGLVAGLAGVLYTCETSQGDPKAGVAYELDAIAAAVIGGTSLMGGKGGILGTFVGALALGILANLLGLRNVDENVQWMLKAVIILVAVWLQSVGTRQRATA